MHLPAAMRLLPSLLGRLLPGLLLCLVTCMLRLLPGLLLPYLLCVLLHQVYAIGMETVETVTQGLLRCRGVLGRVEHTSATEHAMPCTVYGGGRFQRQGGRGLAKEGMQCGVAKSGDASINSYGGFHNETFNVFTLTSVVHVGALEQAMQEAESQGVLSSSDEVHIGSSNSSSKYRRSEGRPAKGDTKNKAKGNAKSNRRQESLPQVTHCDVTKTLLAAAGYVRLSLLFLFFSFWGGGASVPPCHTHGVVGAGQPVAGHWFGPGSMGLGDIPSLGSLLWVACFGVINTTAITPSIALPAPS